MRHEECTTNLAAIGVVTISVENLFIQINVVYVHGSVEGDGDHLRYLVGFDASGDASTVGGAETVREDALVGIAVWSSIGVHIDG